MSKANLMNRRTLLTSAMCLAATTLVGCARRPERLASGGAAGSTPASVRAMYAAMPQERYPVPAVNLARLNPAYYRARVPYPTDEKPGTIIVETAKRYLYLVESDGFAMRYGVGIGRDGFAWSGRGYIGRKAEWPVWTPPAAMIERQPELEEFRNGMAPGPENPLGARALYIYTDGRDTLYRLHGNPDETSIGRAVSSGCVRMLQQDVIDLYLRATVGAEVIVI